MSDHVLTVTAATYTYPGAAAPAVQDVDLTVDRGECVALLGPNGAGKTTLVRMITGLSRPAHGQVRVADGDPTLAATRRRLGVMLQDGEFPRHLTVRELVAGAAVRAGLPASAADPVLTEVGVADLAGRRAKALSGGQRQRVHLARALVVDPAVLVLDEPTVGLDGDSRRGFWRRLAARRDRGMAVLLTTHLIEEAGAVADRVAVIADGRLVVDTDPAGLLARLPDRVVTARTSLTPAAVAEVVRDARGQLRDDQLRDGRLRISTAEPELLLRRLLTADPDLRELRVTGASLEEAVLAVTAHPTTPATTAPTAATDGTAVLTGSEHA